MSLAANQSHAVHLTLAPLTLDDTAQLAEILLGRALSVDAAAVLHARTGGHALYLRTLLSDGPVEQVLRSDRAAVVPSLVALIERQLAAVPPEARALAETLAVLGAPTPLRVAASVAGLAGPDAVAGALGHLLRAGLAEWRPAEPATPVGLRHIIQRDAVYAQLTPDRRRRLHLAAAKALGAAAAWDHLVAASAGTSDAVLAARLDAVAAEDRGHGRHALAATRMLWASDLSESREDYERRLATAVLDLSAADQVRRSFELRGELEACAPGFLRDLALMVIEASRGRLSDALGYAQRLLGAVRRDPGDAQAAGQASYVLSGTFLVLDGRAAEAVECAQWALSAGRLRGSKRSSTQACLLWGVLIEQGLGEALREASRLPPEALEPGVGNADAIAARGMLRALSGRLAAGRTDLRTALHLARDGDQLIFGRRAAGFAVWAGFVLGAWDDAAPAPAGGPRLPWYDHPFDNLAPVWTATGRGDWARAQRQLELIREHGETAERGGQHLCTGIARALLGQARRDYGEMYDALGALRDDKLLNLDRVRLERWWRPLLAEAQIGTGRFTEAEECLARLGEAPHAPYLQLQTGRLAGWLLERRGQTEAAVAAYARAASTPVTADDAPPFRAMLDLAFGRALRTSGRRQEAAVRLRRAHTVLSALQARPLLEDSERELELCGSAAPARMSSYTAALTDREREIAGQVGAGRTNREIAAELFISAKTVEYHLGNIYIKLGISGRRQLRDLVQQHRGPS
jgi:DNA-binding CsgD family transcriptional regulator